MAKSSGIQLITGSFTPAKEGMVLIDYGKSVSRYILLIEMDDASVESLAEAGLTSNKAYGFLSIYQWKEVNGSAPSIVALYCRYNGSSTTSSSVNISMTDSGFALRSYDISMQSSSTLIIGYTYNYTVIPIDL